MGPKREIFYNNIFSKIDLETASVIMILKCIQNTYELFDQLDHENLIKIYPENLFCNSYLEDRCGSQ